MKWILVASALCLFNATPAVGQSAARSPVFPEENGAALAGVRTVDARTYIVTWLEMPGDRERLKANIQSAFELGLRRDGVVVDPSAPNYLFCRVSFAQAGSIVSYAYAVEYFGYADAGVQPLLWRGSGVVTVGRSNFNAEDVAKTCTDAFANVWLKWNPPR